MEWTGTDRVVVRDGRSVVVEVSYDTAPIGQALTAASRHGHRDVISCVGLIELHRRRGL
jgi:hypothetical protein